VTKIRNSILSLPSSGCAKFSKLAVKYARNDIVLETHESPSLILNQLLQNGAAYIGLFVNEPSVRLAKEYRQNHKDKKSQLSFEDFYSDLNRIDESEHQSKLVNVKKLGFVGCEELLIKSLLLSQEWLSTNLTKIPYGELFKRSRTVAVSVKDQENIRKLYHKEYALYIEVLKLVEERWEAYKLKNNIAIASGKKIVIHLGPPKTGTSALQAWLSNGAKQLLLQKTLYPSHGSDVNGVSSGNFSQLISFDNMHRGYFDYEKAVRLVEKFNCSDNETLLLSSEHFYYYLMWFFTFLNDASFIFYIRHPISVLESGYHQGVKRHLRQDDFVTPNSVSFSNLKVVSSISSELHANVKYRFFDESLFEGGSLYSDFASCFPKFIPSPTNVKRLNTQYSAGALMLMRMVNGFGDNFLRTELDLWLQRDSEGQSNFSLIPPDKVGHLQNCLINEANKLKKQTEGMDSVKLNLLLQQYKQVNFFTKEEMDRDFERVLVTLRRSSPFLVFSILTQCKATKDDEAFKTLKEGFGVKDRHLKYLPIANRFSKIRYKLNRIVSRLSK